MKLRAALAAGLFATTLSASAFADPVRILVAAGSRVGLAAERPLKFAGSDAARVRDVEVSLGGVKNENAYVLTEPSRAELFGAIDKAKAEAAKHKAGEVTLIFYFSGHGDHDAIHLGDDRLLLTDLSNKLAEVPAGLRIAVTDACRATRDKGFTADEPFAITATNMPQASGQVWLHASSDGEAAQESDELQGAIFTHSWLNGLRGAADANGDSRVTLEESFAFAHSQTMIRSAKSSGVLQKPEAVVSLREAAPVVLTETTTLAKMATLSLPPGPDAHFLVYTAGSKTVLSELWSSPDRRMALRLPPGRYVVQRRIGGAGGLATLNIGEGELRNVDDREFTSTSLEVLARKGDPDAAPEPDRPSAAPPPPLRHHELSAGYDLGTNTRTGFVHGPRLGYAYALSTHFALTVGGGLELTGRDLDTKDEHLVGGYGRANIEYRIPIGAFTLRVGLGGRAGVVSQTLDPTSHAPATDTRATKSAFEMGPEAFAAARLNLDSSQRAFLDLGATGNILFLEQDNALTSFAAVMGTASLGLRF